MEKCVTLAGFGWYVPFFLIMSPLQRLYDT